MSLKDRLLPPCDYCGRRSAYYVDRCPFCYRHPDYEYPEDSA